mgnify:CR=1 FL=1
MKNKNIKTSGFSLAKGKNLTGDDFYDIKTIGDFHMSTSLDYKINPGHPVFLHGLKVEINITEPQMISFEKKLYRACFKKRPGG